MEASPDGKVLGAAGCKLDAGKAPVFTGLLGYFPKALEGVAEVSQAGIAKGYAPYSWRSATNGRQRYLNAAARHLLKVGAGVVYDSEEGGTGCRHDVMVAWNVLAAVELAEEL